jgi:hypothetical protein
MVSATGTTTLGFIVWTIALSAVGWGANVASNWYGLKREKADRPLHQAFRGSLRSGVFLAVGITGLVVISFVVFVVRTIYDDHLTLVGERNVLINTNAALTKELELRKHSMVTNDPVFPNTIYLLQAFQIFRHAQGGKPCVVMVSAPPEGSSMASMVAQFTNSVSGCVTFGPMNSTIDPDVETRARKGMIPDIIVFHAARDHMAADQLFGHLGNLMPLKRSYELPSPVERTRLYSIPAQGQEDLIWLQFGTNVQWNSARFTHR